MELNLEPDKKSSFQCENQKLKYYRRDEVVVHNSVGIGLWFIINKRVLDLTSLFKIHSVESRMYYAMEELRVYAGKDISHFFNGNDCLNAKTRTAVDGRTVPLLAAVVDDVSKIDSEEELIPWYNDAKYVIGQITSEERRIRIINTLIASTVYLRVCVEDTINDILNKYLHYNSNAKNYLWKRWSSDGSRTINLKMSRTLTENKLFKEEIDDDLPPAIWLYYVDELTGYLDVYDG